MVGMRLELRPGMVRPVILLGATLPVLAQSGGEILARVDLLDFPGIYLGALSKR